MSQTKKDVSEGKKKKFDDRYYIFCMIAAPIVLILNFLGILDFSRFLLVFLTMCFIIGVIYLPQFLKDKK